MKMSLGDAIRHAAEKTGRSIRSIAADAGVSEDTLKNLVQGKAQRTNFENAQKIVAAFGVSIDDFLEGNLSGAAKPIAVAGLVGAGAQVPLIDAYEKGDGLYHVAAPPQLRNGGKSVVAVQVEGDSMAPTYEPGDVLFYTRDVIGVPSEAIGRKCVVCDEAGDVWLKIVRRRDGQPEGYYDLVSINAEVAPRYDVRLQWAAPVRMALSAEMIERV